MKYIIDPIPCAQSRLRQEFIVYVPPQKNVTFFEYLQFSFVFFCPGNLAFKKTNVEGTHLTLAAIPFIVEVNSS